MNFDPSRQQATWYQKLGPPKDPHINVTDEEQIVELDPAARRKLRRGQVIGSMIIFLILVALIVAFYILKPQFLGG